MLNNKEKQEFYAYIMRSLDQNEEINVAYLQDTLEAMKHNLPQGLNFDNMKTTLKPEDLDQDLLSGFVAAFQNLDLVNNRNAMMAQNPYHLNHSYWALWQQNVLKAYEKCWAYVHELGKRYVPNH